MATKTKKKAVIFIEKNAFFYFDESSTNILQFPFPPNLVQDLEIFDKDGLAAQIKTFVQTNKVLPASLMLVVSDSIIFEKVVPVSDLTKKDQEINTFLENIPFENVISKVYDQGKGYKIIAFNKDFYSALKSSFEILEFHIVGIIPNFILGNMGSSGTLQINTARYILGKFDVLQKENLFFEPVKPSILNTDLFNPGANDLENQSESGQPPIKKKSTLPLLLPVFFILFIVLGAVIYMQFSSTKKPSPVPSTIVAPSIISSPTPTIELQPTLTSTPSATPKK